MSEPKEIELADKMNRGRLAEQSSTYLLPFLQDQADRIMSDMVAKLQEGETNFCAHAGKCQLIIDMKTSIKREVTMGNQAAKELNNGL